MIVDKNKKSWLFVLIVVVIITGLIINGRIKSNQFQDQIEALKLQREDAIVLKEFWEEKANQSDSSVKKMEDELSLYKDSLFIVKARIKHIKKYYDEKIVNVDTASLNTSIRIITDYYR